MRDRASIKELSDPARFVRRGLPDHLSRLTDWDLERMRDELGITTPRKAVRPVPWLALAFAIVAGFIFLVGLWTVSQW